MLYHHSYSTPSRILIGGPKTSTSASENTDPWRVAASLKPRVAPVVDNDVLGSDILVLLPTGVSAAGASFTSSVEVDSVPTQTTSELPLPALERDSFTAGIIIVEFRRDLLRITRRTHVRTDRVIRWTNREARDAISNI